MRLEKPKSQKALSFTAMLWTALKMALRELRGGLRGFYIFVACIALGVASIAGVGSLARSLNDGIAQQGQIILGGDVALSRVHQRISQPEKTGFENFGRISEIATMRSMARRLDRNAQSLIEIKAVDGAYPLYGNIKTENQTPVNLQKMNALADSILLDQLNIKVGDQVRLGTGLVTIVGTIASEPDRLSSRNLFGPRLLLSLETLEATELIEPGSLIRWHYRLQLNDQTTDVDELTKNLEQTYRPSGFLVRNRLDPAPGISDAISRLGKFLVLVGLTALLIGGVGVANAVNTFIDQKRTNIATFRCLGATASLIFSTYFIQVVIIAAFGVAIGLTIGALVPALLSYFFANILPFELVLTPQITELAAASLYGFLVALLFVIWPLNRVRNIRPQTLFRDRVSGESTKIRVSDALIILVLAFGLGSLAIFTAELPWVAFYFCTGLGILFLLFIAYGYVMKKLIQKVPKFQNPTLSLARVHLIGPNSLTRTIILSLGLGLTLLVTVGLIDTSLRAQLSSGLSQKAPNYFFVDIKKDQLQPFTKVVNSAVPEGQLNIAPMLRGRIISLKGIPTEKIQAPNEVKWILNGDRGITYSDKQPEGSELVEGTWWSEKYNGPALVSFEAEAGKAFGLKIGDEIRINILGREIAAKIANFRTVKWESLSINFVMIFSSNALSGAPFNMLATLQLTSDETISNEGQFMQQMSKQFPNITVVRVRDAIQAINGIYQRIIFAISLAGSITLIAGTLVLAGALATAHRRRIYEAAIYKTLGATRKRIISSHMLEYFSLACLTSILAIILGTIAAWSVVKFVLDFPFHFSLATSIQTVMFTCLLVMLFGAIGSWRVLSAKTSTYLRKE